MKAFKSILVVVAAVVFAACGSQSNSNNAASHANMNHNATTVPSAEHSTMDHGSMDHSTMKSSPNASDAEYDLQFIDTMIAHHQGAVDMAKLIQAKAVNDELKKLGINIISSQEKEIAAMRAWRDQWFGGKPPAINMEMAGMAASMSGMDMQKLDSLSGKAFDLEFVKQMIPHHEGAVVMAKEALKRSKKDEIKTLAAAIIRDQQAEIQQMTGWQQEWNK